MNRPKIGVLELLEELLNTSLEKFKMVTPLLQLKMTSLQDSVISKYGVMVNMLPTLDSL